MTDWTYPEDVPNTTVEKLHQWLRSGNPADAATSSEKAVADIIRTFWPEPARTLAEELRTIGKKYSGEVEVDLDDLADRAEQLEKERDDLEHTALNLEGDLHEARALLAAAKHAETQKEGHQLGEHT